MFAGLTLILRSLQIVFVRLHAVNGNNRFLPDSESVIDSVLGILDQSSRLPPRQVGTQVGRCLAAFLGLGFSHTYFQQQIIFLEFIPIN